MPWEIRRESNPQAAPVLGERSIAAVQEGDIRRVEPGETSTQPQLFAGREAAAFGFGVEFAGDVGVLGIPPVAGGDEQVLEPVEIDIEEHRAPGPIGGVDAGEYPGRFPRTNRCRG